MFAAVA